MSFVLSSCKDDEPFVKPKLSVEAATKSVAESAGTIDIVVQLDKAFSSDITIDYTLGGTATEGSAASADYQVTGTLGEVKILSGQTTGKITLAIVQDQLFEGDETIEIRLKDVDSDNIAITTDDKIVVTITDDDSRAKISFASATMTASEDNRSILVQFNLDKAVSSDVTVLYAVSGTAVDSVAGSASTSDNLLSDYQIKGTKGQFTITAGQTTASMKIKSYSDFYLEDDETIILTLQSAGTQVELGAIAETTITLDQEDGKIIALFWDDTYTTVDMDLFLWIGDPGTAVADLSFIALSAFAGFEGPEFVFIPSVVTDADVGMSYTYYAGDVEPMNFTVQFIDFVDGVSEGAATRDIFMASYNKVNINVWDNQTTGIDPIIVQTVSITGGVYGTASTISIPVAGSRFASPELPAHVGKQGNLSMSSKQIQKMLRK